MKVFKVAPLLCLSLFIASTSIYAAAEEEQIIVKKREKIVYEETSEANRMGKKFNANLQLLGAGPQSMAGSGVIGGIFLDSNNLILAEVLTGKSQFELLGSKWERSSTAIGVHYKQFVSNSFYWRAGTEYSQVKSVYSYKSSLNTVDRELSGNVLTGSLVIGNQWQWENFTLGCDWIGLSSPLTSTTTAKNIKTTFNDNLDQEFMDAEEKRIFKDGGVHLLRFYVGASF